MLPCDDHDVGVNLGALFIQKPFCALIMSWSMMYFHRRFFLMRLVPSIRGRGPRGSHSYNIVACPSQGEQGHGGSSPLVLQTLRVLHWVRDGLETHLQTRDPAWCRGQTQCTFRNPMLGHFLVLLHKGLRILLTTYPQEAF